jgi:hypothetical protein
LRRVRAKQLQVIERPGRTFTFSRASKQRMRRYPFMRTVRMGQLGISFHALGTTAGRFEELERLRAGVRGQRRVTWLNERLALVRSSQGLAVIAVAPVWQLVAFSLGGAFVAALVAALLVGGVLENVNDRQEQAKEQAGEIAALHKKMRVLVERTTQAEHERIVSLIEAGRRSVSAMPSSRTR